MSPLPSPSLHLPIPSQKAVYRRENVTTILPKYVPQTQAHPSSQCSSDRDQRRYVQSTKNK